MIIRPKHYLLIIIGLILATFIFYVNHFLLGGTDRPIGPDLYLSVCTFFLWIGCWALYFELRDFWQFRWYGRHVDHPNISIKPLIFTITWEKSKEKYLHGEMLQCKTSSTNSSKFPLVIFSHGFSDNSLYVRHYTVPIALAGFDVISYDCRGSGKSRKVGSSHQFTAITHDLGDIIRNIQNNDDFKGRDIILVGISLGSVASIRQGIYFSEKGVKKIIAVSAIGNYLDVMPSSPIPFKQKWWFWLRYNFFRVPINPLPAINEQISPLLQLLQKKKSLQNEENWTTYANNTLFFIHSLNDKVIPIINFKKNYRLAQMKGENWVLTKRGGHNFLKYELSVISAIIERLKR